MFIVLCLQSMLSLKVIQLESLCSLTSFPDVSEAPNVERLVLSNCGNLVEVHESFGFLKRLIYLKINGCSSLKFMSSKFEMDSLETFIISECRLLERLPEFSPCMIKLSHININYCASLKKIPNSVFELKHLSTLCLGSCHMLSVLSISMLWKICFA